MESMKKRMESMKKPMEPMKKPMESVRLGTGAVGQKGREI